MEGSPVTLTYTRPGIQEPVYLTTNMSTPPWELRKMLVKDETTANGDPVFYLEFKDVPEGSYQYKMRIGEHEWVHNPKRFTTRDNDGNINNTYVVHRRRHSAADVAYESAESDASQEDDPEAESSEDVPLLPHERRASSDATTQTTQSYPAPQESRPVVTERKMSVNLETITESDSEEDEAVGDTVHPVETNELGSDQLLPHETHSGGYKQVATNTESVGDQAKTDLDHTGLFSYETHARDVSSDSGGSSSDTDVDSTDQELGGALLLPHESLYGVDADTETTDTSIHTDTDSQLDLGPATKFLQEKSSILDDDDIPLLPHERIPTVLSEDGSESNVDSSPSEDNQQLFSYENPFQSVDYSRPELDESESASDLYPEDGGLATDPFLDQDKSLAELEDEKSKVDTLDGATEPDASSANLNRDVASLPKTDGANDLLGPCQGFSISAGFVAPPCASKDVVGVGRNSHTRQPSSQVVSKAFPDDVRTGSLLGTQAKSEKASDGLLLSLWKSMGIILVGVIQRVFCIGPYTAALFLVGLGIAVSSYLNQ